MRPTLKRVRSPHVHSSIAAASPLAAPNATLPAKRRGYWHDSRAPRYSLTFALPLLILYELMAAGLSEASNGVRNGADVLLKSAFQAVLGERGQPVFGALLVGTMLVFIIRDLRRAPGGLKGSTFVAMLAESVVLAGVFGTVVGMLTAQLVGALAGAGASTGTGLAMGGLDGVGWPTALMVSLGAGLYEELLFRVILVSVLLWVAKKIFGWGPVASGTFATLTGALIFSAFHYVGPFGDRLELASFTFRAIAGVAFSALYVVRGFGITAWTHALYDVMLLATRG
ncbi:MAG: CPBP family intramembrane metalloprotease [Gemmatimonadaceae bacterium]|nr:CPBP family intramembrane metalloprotease [Gemmatimonadaceae bacterium]